MIIDPSFFYWINTVNWLKVACLLVGALLTAVSVALGINSITSYFDNDDNYKKYKKICLYILPFCIIFCFIGIFTPNKNTLIEMQIVKIATRENIEITVETIKSIIDYIIETVQSFK